MKNALTFVYPALHSWMCLIESSNTEVSSASEMSQSRGKLFLNETQLLCFCSSLILINLD